MITVMFDPQPKEHSTPLPLKKVNPLSSHVDIESLKDISINMHRDKSV